jgi:hypothetical protein
VAADWRPAEAKPDWQESMVDAPIWEFTHAIECETPREFAWAYWTNAENWDDPPARFEFDGRFAAGTRLTTILPGQKLESVIREVVEGRAARIEMEAMGAVVEFQWRFGDSGEMRTRISQRISLGGAGADRLLGQARVLQQSVPQGMARLAKNIEASWTEKRI